MRQGLIIIVLKCFIFARINNNTAKLKLPNCVWEQNVMFKGSCSPSCEMLDTQHRQHNLATHTMHQDIYHSLLNFLMDYYLQGLCDNVKRNVQKFFCTCRECPFKMFSKINSFIIIYTQDLYIMTCYPIPEHCSTYKFWIPGSNTLVL